MTGNENSLARLAERGEVRGPDEVLRSARAEAAQGRPPGRGWIPAAAALLAAAATVGLILAVGGDDQSDVRTVGRTPDATAPLAPSSEPPTSPEPPTTPTDVPSVTAFGFTAEEGIVRIVHPGPDGGAAERRPIGGVRGEEGSTNLAVTPRSDVVFHNMLFSGCLTNLVRTEVEGDSQILAENAAHPALDQAGERLAHASGTECTADADVLVVRNLDSGEAASVQIGGDDDLPFRIQDVEWVGDRIAVLASQYDGQHVSAQWLLLYSVPQSGPPVFDDQLQLGDQASGTLDDLAYPNIEPVPGDPGSVLRARSSSDGGNDLTVLDLGTGDERTLFSLAEQITAFAARDLDDVLYVATLPKVEGEQPQGDTLRRRVGGQDVAVAKDVTSVAIPAP